MEGQEIRLQTTCRGKAEHFTCTPVVDALNGQIRHLLLVFSDSSDSLCMLSAATGHIIKSEPPSQPTHALPPTINAQTEPIPPADMAHGFFACPRGLGSGPAIFPRRKPQSLDASNTSPQPVAPVVVTLGLLDSIRDLPLIQAAAKLGVSPTAFKKACRRLGVSRWAYRRNRDAAASGGRRQRRSASVAAASAAAVAWPCGELLAGRDGPAFSASGAAPAADAAILCTKARRSVHGDSELPTCRAGAMGALCGAPELFLDGDDFVHSDEGSTAGTGFNAGACASAGVSACHWRDACDRVGACHLNGFRVSGPVSSGRRGSCGGAGAWPLAAIVLGTEEAAWGDGAAEDALGLAEVAVAD
jgi:hypothetical protein